MAYSVELKDQQLLVILSLDDALEAEKRQEHYRNMLLDLLEKTEAMTSLLNEKHLNREKMGEAFTQLSNCIWSELNK